MIDRAQSCGCCQASATPPQSGPAPQSWSGYDHQKRIDDNVPAQVIPETIVCEWGANVSALHGAADFPNVEGRFELITALSGDAQGKAVTYRLRMGGDPAATNGVILSSAVFTGDDQPETVVCAAPDPSVGAPNPPCVPLKLTIEATAEAGGTIHVETRGVHAELRRTT